MSLNQSISYPVAGQDMVFQVLRKSDRTFYDFASQSFSAAPKQPAAPAPEESPISPGVYTGSIESTPQAVFTNGDYQMRFFPGGGKACCQAVVDFAMNGGSDAWVFTIVPASLTLTGVIGSLNPPPAGP
jgi:hypothetical protein